MIFLKQRAIIFNLSENDREVKSNLQKESCFIVTEHFFSLKHVRWLHLTPLLAPSLFLVIPAKAGTHSEKISGSEKLAERKPQ